MLHAVISTTSNDVMKPNHLLKYDIRLSNRDVLHFKHQRHGVLAEATGAYAEVALEVVREVRRVFVAQVDRHNLEGRPAAHHFDRLAHPQGPEPVVRCRASHGVKAAFQLSRRQAARGRKLGCTVVAVLGEGHPIRVVV